ncbi:MAG: RNase adapter RapZ, partial [Proteobacteria bacterium]
MKRLLIVSGRSGSGKSSALHILEDIGYYSIDNLPLSLLPEIVAKLDQENHLDMLALGVDVR